MDVGFKNLGFELWFFISILKNPRNPGEFDPGGLGFGIHLEKNRDLRSQDPELPTPACPSLVLQGTLRVRSITTNSRFSTRQACLCAGEISSSAINRIILL